MTELTGAVSLARPSAKASEVGVKERPDVEQAARANEPTQRPISILGVVPLNDGPAEVRFDVLDLHRGVPQGGASEDQA